MDNGYKGFEEIIVEFEQEFANETTKKGSIERLLNNLHSYYPCPRNWFQMATLSVTDAVFVYYNIDPEGFECSQLSQLDRQKFIYRIDFELKLNRNLINSLGIADCDLCYNEISFKDYLNYLIENGYSIPDHFPERFKSGPLLNGGIKETPPAELDSMGPKTSRYKAETIRIEYVRAKARIKWYQELQMTKEGKPGAISSASKLAKSMTLKDAAITANIELKLPPLGAKSDNLVQEEFKRLKDKPKEYREYLQKLDSQALVDEEWLKGLHPNVRLK
jgi:hypothetical protein